MSLSYTEISDRMQALEKVWPVLEDAAIGAAEAVDDAVSAGLTGHSASKLRLGAQAFQQVFNQVKREYNELYDLQIQHELTNRDQ